MLGQLGLTHHLARAIVDVEGLDGGVLAFFLDAYQDGLCLVLRFPVLTFLHTVLLFEVVHPQRFAGGAVQHLDLRHVAAHHVGEIIGEAVPAGFHGEFARPHLGEVLLGGGDDRKEQST